MILDFLRDFGSTVFSQGLFILLIALYFLPSIIASKRKSSRKNTILAINLLFGWTFIVWILLLAVSFDTRRNKSNNSSPSKYQQIEELKTLFDKKVLSQKEYEAAKSKLLNV